MAIILKIFVIRFTLKNLICELSSSFDTISDSEEGNILFLKLAVMFKTKKKNERERKHFAPGFFRKREEKGAFNNLTRNETGRRSLFSVEF